MSFSLQDTFLSVDLRVSNSNQNSKDSIHCLRYIDALTASNTAFRNALILGYSDHVTIYDVLNQKITKEIKLSQYDNHPQSLSATSSSFSTPTLTTLAVNQRLGRGHVAVGGKNGHLRIISLNAEVSGPPAIDSKLQDITSLKFSRFKQSLLAGSSNSGTVALWDANAVKRTSSFSEHRAPASDLAFSPMNEMLLSSSGLDKRCFCYDVLSGKTAATIKTNEPLTCVDFHHDGTTIALGTSKGNIFVYDLRSTKDPCHTLRAHHGKAIRCLSYQPKGDKKSLPKNRSASLLKQTSKKNMMSEVSKENLHGSITSQYIDSINGSPNFKTKKIDTAPISTPSSSHIFSNTRDNSTEQLFSPVGRVEEDNSQVNYTPLNVSARNTSNLSSHSRLSNNSLFSPLRENSSNLSSSSMINEPFQQTTPLQMSTKTFSSPLPVIDEMHHEDISSIKPNADSQITHNIHTTKLIEIDAISKVTGSLESLNAKHTASTLSEIKMFDLVSQNDPYHDNKHLNQESVEGLSAVQPSFEIENIIETQNDNKQSQLNFEEKLPQHREHIGKDTCGMPSNISDAKLSKRLPETSVISHSAQEATSTDDVPILPILPALPSISGTGSVIPSSRIKDAGVDSGYLQKEHKNEMSNIKAMMTAFPEALDMFPRASQNFQKASKMNSSREDSQKNGAVSASVQNDILNCRPETADSGTPNIQRDYLKSVVDECMDEFTSEVRKHLWRIEWDITENFHRLKEENDSRQERFSIIYENMMLENERLRKENEELKKSRQFFQ